MTKSPTWRLVGFLLKLVALNAALALFAALFVRASQVSLAWVACAAGIGIDVAIVAALAYNGVIRSKATRHLKP